MSGSGPLVEENKQFYRENPTERIVDVHWKKKDDGGGPPPTPCEGPCGSGWFYLGHIWLGDKRGAGTDLAGNPAVDGAGAVWDPTGCCPATPIGFDPATGAYDPTKYIPGNCATRCRITLQWFDVIPDPTHPLWVGVWVFKNLGPYPPYHNLNDPTAPPLPPERWPPYNPDVQANVNASSTGSLLGFDEVDWFGTSVIVDFASTLSGPPSLASRQGLTRPTDVVPLDDPHYGEPGTEPTGGGAYITIDFTCQPGHTFSTPLMPSLRIPARHRRWT